MSNSAEITVYCMSSLKCQQNKALTLARQLGVPLSPSKELLQGQFQLIYTDHQLELHCPNMDVPNKPWKLYTDFVRGSTGYRKSHNSNIKQPLARAVGIKPGFRPTIVDATAGMGVDGFVMALLGCQVTMVERSPIIAALLEDGLNRVYQDPTTANFIQNRINLIKEDAQKCLSHLSPAPYTVYLDPMYPTKKKSALNKKEMRIIRSLVGDDLDASYLLSCSLQYTQNRVVVKRPRGASTISPTPPSHTIEMKNSRFDVYLKANYSHGL